MSPLVFSSRRFVRRSRDAGRARGSYDLIELAIGIILVLVVILGVIAAYNYNRQRLEIAQAEQQISNVASAVKAMSANTRGFTGIDTSSVATSGMLPQAQIVQQNSSNVSGSSGSTSSDEIVTSFGNGQIVVTPATN